MKKILPKRVGFFCGFILELRKMCNFANDNKRPIMVKDKVAYWTDIADYDLKTAEAMCQTGRWLYVAFMCHQVIEKTLKAYWCGTQPDDPPYTHNHMRLADGCGLYDKMNDEQKDFLDLVTNYNIEARYPEDKEALARTLTPQVCRQLIDDTKQLMTWIIEQLSAVTKP